MTDQPQCERCERSYTFAHLINCAGYYVCERCAEAYDRARRQDEWATRMINHAGLSVTADRDGARARAQNDAAAASGGNDHVEGWKAICG